MLVWGRVGFPKRKVVSMSSFFQVRTVMLVSRRVTSHGFRERVRRHWKFMQRFSATDGSWNRRLQLCAIFSQKSHLIWWTSSPSRSFRCLVFVFAVTKRFLGGSVRLSLILAVSQGECYSVLKLNFIWSNQPPAKPFQRLDLKDALSKHDFLVLLSWLGTFHCNFNLSVAETFQNSLEANLNLNKSLTWGKEDTSSMKHATLVGWKERLDVP